MPALIGLDLLRGLAIVLTLLAAEHEAIRYLRSRAAVPGAFINDPSLAGENSLVRFGAFFLVALVLLPPVMFISARLSLAGQGIVIERLGLLQSFKRSWQLTSDAGWRLLLYIIVITLLTRLVIVLPTSFIAVLLIRLLNVPYFDLAARILSQCVTLPFTVIALTLMYYDLRRRTAGLDLEQQTAE